MEEVSYLIYFLNNNFFVSRFMGENQLKHGSKNPDPKKATYFRGAIYSRWNRVIVFFLFLTLQYRLCIVMVEQMTLTEKIVHVFAVWGRKKMKKRLFEGNFFLLLEGVSTGKKYGDYFRKHSPMTNHCWGMQLELSEKSPSCPPFCHCFKKGKGWHLY